MSVTVRILGDDSDLQNKLRDSASKIAKWSAAATAAAAAGGAALIRSGLQSADAQAKLARQLGTTSKDLGIATRAFDMAGVSQEKLTSGTRALTNRLSQAAQGTGTAVDALDQLGLSANELIGLPLSERIGVINQALQNNVAASEQAAIAAQIYGEEAGLAIGKVDPATIATATEQIERFNASLTEVEAAQVEAANDAIGRIGLATDGVTKKLAAEFAPVLEAASSQILDMAEEMGGFGSVSESVFENVTKATGFVADAFHGIKVTFQTVADGIIIGSSLLAQNVAEVMASIMEAASNVPGLDYSESIASTREFAEQQKDIISSAKQAIHNRLMEPLPSEGLESWVFEVKKQSERVAQIQAEAKEAEREKAAEDGEVDLELLREKFAAENEVLQQYLDTKAGKGREWRREDIKNEQDYAEAMAAINERLASERLGLASGMFSNLSSLMDTENKKLFQIGKAAALAQATIDGYSSVLSSYREGTKIGGPAVGAAFAATAAVATGVQIAKIASASYGSGGGAPAAAATSNPNVPAQDQVGGQGGGQSQQDRTVRIEQLDPNALVSGSMINTIAEELVQLQDDGFRLVV